MNQCIFSIARWRNLIANVECILVHFLGGEQAIDMKRRVYGLGKWVAVQPDYFEAQELINDPDYFGGI